MDDFVDILNKIKTNKPLCKHDIYRLVPQREPFLMIDNILMVDIENRYIKAEKIINENEYYFKGHFPNNYITPGVIIIEALAQTASALSRLIVNKSGVYMLAGIEKAEFLKVITPKTNLFLEAKIIIESDPLIKAECQAFTDNNTRVASCILKAFRK